MLRHYPDAELDLRSEGKHNPSLDGLLCRALGMHYFSPFEAVSIRISRHPNPIDCKDFRGMHISYLTFEHGVIADIQPLLAMYRPDVSFVACDFSRLPDDQKQFLHYYPRFDSYTLHSPDDAVPRYPGGYSLSSGRFYP